MKRNLRFRIWHKKYKKLLEPSMAAINGHGKLLELTPDGDYLLADESCIDDYVIMQYIGEDCKDCNGIELCQDDLVTNEYSECPLLITYSHGCFYSKAVRKYKNYGFYREMSINELVTISSTQIIGNIHQNPDLLPKGFIKSLNLDKPRIAEDETDEEFKKRVKTFFNINEETGFPNAD